MSSKSILWLLAYSPVILIPAQISGAEERVRVIDGDTIKVAGHSHRLKDIDAPEKQQQCYEISGRVWPCGQAATEALKVKISRGSLSCQSDGTDQYSRSLSFCFIDTINLNAWMVRQGWAVASRYYSDQFIPEEEHARREKLGLWSGHFVMPWDWRRGSRFQQNKISN